MEVGCVYSVSFAVGLNAYQCFVCHTGLPGVVQPALSATAFVSELSYSYIFSFAEELYLHVFGYLFGVIGGVGTPYREEHSSVVIVYLLYSHVSLREAVHHEVGTIYGAFFGHHYLVVEIFNVGIGKCVHIMY